MKEKYLIYLVDNLSSEILDVLLPRNPRIMDVGFWRKVETVCLASDPVIDVSKLLKIMRI